MDAERAAAIGAWDPWAEAMRMGPESVVIGGVSIGRGSRVRIAPARRADILDLALGGQSAVVEALEQDFEGRVQVAVILDADPGRDLGAMRQPGHRFFFAPEELTPLESGAEVGPGPRILLAGIGNVFVGDDGFGVELAGRLAAEDWPDGIEVRDYGIRGFDLALALLEPWDRIVLLDAAPRGGAPGTVYWEEIATGRIAAEGGLTEPHDLRPEAVLRLAGQMGKPPETVWLAGCEPGDRRGPSGSQAPGDADQAGLSPAVAAALPAAAELVRRKLEEWRREWRGEVVTSEEGRGK